MSNKEITKNSQARMIRSWMLGLHATHITDIGGRLGYFSEMRRRGGTVSAEALAAALKLDPWRTKVWCQAACAVGVLQADGDTQFTFAPFMNEITWRRSSRVADHACPGQPVAGLSSLS